MMQISQAGIDAIKRHEGLRLFAYQDVAGVWTVGYGSTKGVEPGQHITSSEAEFRLRRDLEWVEKCIADNVTVPLTQNQYDALCSLIFNIGSGAFKDSTLLRKLNAGDYAGAAEQFTRWDKATVGGVLQPVAGLASRRRAEQSLFSDGIDTEPLVQLGPEPYTPPRPDQEPYTQETAMPIPAIVAALIPSLIEQIPKLSKYFPGGRVSERNVALATTALEVVQVATQSSNAQAAIETMASNPTAREAAAKAVDARWSDLHKLGEESVASAREFSTTQSNRTDVRTVAGKFTFIELFSVLLVGLGAIGMTLLVWGEKLSQATVDSIAMLAMVGTIIAVREFWLGSSAGSRMKDEPKKDTP